MGTFRKPVLFLLTGALTAASLCTAPIAGVSHAFATSPVSSANAAPPVPVQVSKGVQKLVRLVPELSSRYVFYGGDVDGPGVSGVTVTFAKSSAEKDSAADRAIFDSQTGDLLVLELEANLSGKPFVLSDEQVRAKAVSFVAGLQTMSNTYQPREVTRKEGQVTVRLVRKLNNVVLDDSYDCFVHFDSTGRLIGFRTFDGGLYEKVSPATLPSTQRVLSAQQAVQRYQESHPLELVYLLPEQFKGDATVQARLAYVVKDGIITHTHTGSALDAVNGKRMMDQLNYRREPVQTITVNGTGERWTALTEAQGLDLVRKLFRIEPVALPVVSFVEKADEGKERRFFIWGHFREGTTDQEKPYQLGQFPENVNSKERMHILLETDAKTGQLIRLVTKDGSDPAGKTDKKRDWASAEALLKRLIPTGTTPMRMKDVGSEAITQITADPVINGIPVYQEGQQDQEGMYTLTMNPYNGKVEEVILDGPPIMSFPSTSQAISGEAAVDSLLKEFPLELTYIHVTDPQTGAISWKLAYDLSFRQTRSHCFCGGEPKVDRTVWVDAVTGKVIVNE